MTLPDDPFTASSSFSQASAARQPSRFLRLIKLMLMGVAGALLLLLAYVYWGQSSGVETTIESDKMPATKTWTPLQQRTPDRLRVLFIGNSFTQFNGGQDKLLTAMCQAAGVTPLPVFDRIVYGGASLTAHWTSSPALDAIREGHWDFVVLQDHSLEPIEEPAHMRQAISNFDAEIRKARAVPILFMTWARLDEPRDLSIIQSEYDEAGAALHIPVVPVGLAWQLSQQRRPYLRLHQADNKHPNEYGSYLTACMFYQALLHRSPLDLPAQLGDGKRIYVHLKPAEARFLQQIALETSASTTHSSGQ